MSMSGSALEIDDEPSGNEFDQLLAVELDSVKQKVLAEHAKALGRLTCRGCGMIASLAPQCRRAPDDGGRKRGSKVSIQDEGFWGSSTKDEVDQEDNYLQEHSGDKGAVEKLIRSSTLWDRGTSVGNNQVMRKEWEISEELIAANLPDEVEMGRSAPWERIMVETHSLLEEIVSGLPNQGQRRPSVHTSSSFISMDLDNGGALSMLRNMGCLLPLRPHSPAIVVWDLLGLLCVGYDVVTIPLFLMVLPETTFSRAVGLVANIYWSFDVILSFLRSTFVHGMLVDDLRLVARNYLRTWFPPDIFMVSAEWLLLSLGEKRGGLQLLRFLRAARVLRLLRLLKLDKLVREQVKRVNYLKFLHVVAVIKTLAPFFILVHVLTCIWFSLGMQEHGWIRDQGTESGALNSIGQGYLVSLHWTVTQFHGAMEIVPATIPERCYAVFVLIVGMLTLSVIVSTTTDTIFQVRQAHKQVHEQNAKLRVYFLRHKVPTELMVAAKSYMEFTVQQNIEFIDDRDLLQDLPATIQKSILLAARTPTVEAHCFFGWLKNLHASALRDICYGGFKATLYQSNAVVFNFGDACREIYFVEDGSLGYVKKITRDTSGTGIAPPASARLLRTGTGKRRDLRKRDWICEPALWVQGWQNKGTLLTHTTSYVLFLTSDRLSAIVKSFAALQWEASLYARGAFNAIILDPEVDDRWTLVLKDIYTNSNFEADQDPFGSEGENRPGPPMMRSSTFQDGSRSGSEQDDMEENDDGFGDGSTGLSCHRTRPPAQDDYCFEHAEIENHCRMGTEIQRSKI